MLAPSSPLPFGPSFGAWMRQIRTNHVQMPEPLVSSHLLTFRALLVQAWQCRSLSGEPGPSS